ncbi:hypothetical protein SPRA44_760218 [Serratia proteamaculans]|nr:hypothetical protein SPRA44_760218 [Serratia proteamaculans]
MVLASPELHLTHEPYVFAVDA